MDAMERCLNNEQTTTVQEIEPREQFFLDSVDSLMSGYYLENLEKSIASEPANQRTSEPANQRTSEPANQRTSENYSAKTSSCQAFFVENINKINIFGNRCGHLPHVPRVFSAPKKHKRRFPLIEKAKRHLVDAYYHPLRYLVGKLFFHADKLTKKSRLRRRRSEARECLTARVGQVLLHYTNLERMQLGHPNIRTGEFIPYTCEFIATQAGIGLTQAFRTLKIFKDAGYIKIHRRPIKQTDGSFKELPAIIEVSPDFYRDLDITDDELAQYRYKQNKQVWAEALAAKIKEQARIQKEEKREKKFFKKKIAVNRELPGSERIPPHESTLYRDYTGISHNREEVLKRNNAQSQTARGFLSQILAQLKKPPPDKPPSKLNKT